MIKGFERRAKRIRIKVRGNSIRPRLTVFRSNRYISAQIIDDEKGLTLASVSSKDLGKIGALGKKNMDIAFEVGVKLAEKAILKKVSSVSFDKGGYRYHGKVKAVAEGARKGGLEL